METNKKELDEAVGYINDWINRRKYGEITICIRCGEIYHYKFNESKKPKNGRVDGNHQQKD